MNARLTSLAIIAIAAFAEDNTRVQVLQVGSGSGPVWYRYKVLNETGRPIMRLIVGGSAHDKSAHELESAPQAWPSPTQSPLESIGQPAGWAGKVSPDKGGPT